MLIKVNLKPNLMTTITNNSLAVKMHISANCWLYINIIVNCKSKCTVQVHVH